MAVVATPPRERIYTFVAAFLLITALLMHGFGPENSTARIVTYIMFGVGGISAWVAFLNAYELFFAGKRPSLWSVALLSIQTIAFVLYGMYMPNLVMGFLSGVGADAFSGIILVMRAVSLLAGSTLPFGALLSLFIVSSRNRHGDDGTHNTDSENINFKKYVVRAINSLHLR